MQPDGAGFQKNFELLILWVLNALMVTVTRSLIRLVKKQTTTTNNKDEKKRVVGSLSPAGAQKEAPDQTQNEGMKYLLTQYLLRGTCFFLYKNNNCE